MALAWLHDAVIKTLVLRRLAVEHACLFAEDSALGVAEGLLALGVARLEGLGVCDGLLEELLCRGLLCACVAVCGCPRSRFRLDS